MGYRLLYDNQILFDPYTDDTVTDAVLTVKTNTVSYFDFTISQEHSLYNVVAERAGKVELFFNDLKLFSGQIIDINTDLECYKQISCSDALDYLSDTVVRPYSTIEGEQPLTAPSSVDGYFQWLIDQHNEHCLDSSKEFRVGINQGAMLDKNNYIYRSSEQRPTTSSEIEDKILDSLGGYLFVRYDGNSNVLDLYADAHEANTQIIDFGVNIVDFSKSVTTSDQYTAVVVTGYTPDPPEDDPEKEMKPITLEGIQNGGTPYPTMTKMGDCIYDVDAVQRYGYREYYASNDDITTYDGLLEYGCLLLKSLISPSLSITVKAVDLALYMQNGYEHMQVGQAVRVRSKPHNTDEYLMVNSITLDLQDPGNTEYDLGVGYDTLTGQQSSYLKSLNANINSSLDSVASLGDDVKKSAKDAKDAKTEAEEAKKNAEEAAAKADEANTKSDEANAKVDEATEKINTAISDAKDAADKASEASKKADEATAKTELIEKSLTEISGNTDQAIANAKKAQDAADAAKKAADDAQASADANATEVGKVKSQVETINTEISDVKSDATKLRDDLSGQITTVKNTMEADYSRKSDLTDTTETLRNEISESAAGVLRTVSTDYATKSELKTTTDDLSNYVEKTYSTKSEVKQLSDTVSSTVSSLETVKTNAEAAQTSADNAKAAADAAQKAADTAKSNAATAQSTADAAKKNLETAQKNLETLQSQANATDADLATAKANVEKAQKAADAAQTAADTAKTNASTAQATADAAKTAASNAQKDVDSLKDRVTKAETSITQNSEAIALRATKTEVTSAINDISVGGRNIILDTGSFTVIAQSGNYINGINGSLTGESYNGAAIRKITIEYPGAEKWQWIVEDCKPGDLYTFSFWVKGTCEKIRAYFYGPGSYLTALPVKWSSQGIGGATSGYGDGQYNWTVSETWQRVWVVYQLNPSGTGSNKYILIRTDPSTKGKDLYLAGAKLEKGNKPTDWSPAPEDLVSESKTYSDAQLKITADSINTTISTVKSTADAAKTSTDTLETLIRQSGNGVEVAKKVNGSYTSTKTLMGSDGFYVQDASGNTLSSFSKDTIELGKNNRSAKINLCDNSGSLQLISLSGSSTRGMTLRTENGWTGLDAAYTVSNSSGNVTTVNTQARSTVSVSALPGSGIVAETTIRSMIGSDQASIIVSGTGTIAISSQTTSATSSVLYPGIYIRQDYMSICNGKYIAQKLDDFVVAQGTSGDWYYRKWASGRAECWCKVVTSGWSSGWSQQGYNYTKRLEKSLPFTAVSFTSAFANCDYYGYATIEAPRSSDWLTKFITIICESVGSQGVDQNHVVEMYWLGKWK